MKNQIKPIITALLLGVASFANAGSFKVEPTVKPFATGIYKSVGQPTLNVNIDKEKGTKITITLKDRAGEVIYEDTFTKNQVNYRTKINMNQLEKGTYFLELNDGKNTEVKKIEI